MTAQFTQANEAARSVRPAAGVTVIIPTLDECLHIDRAVRSALPLGRVIVVDSGSVDATREMAAAAGAEVVEHGWEGYARQKNWAVDTLVEPGSWTMFLDADEWLPPQLVTEIAGKARSGESEAYYVARRFIFLGREMRHAWWYPDYQLRLFRAGVARYEQREVHEHMLCSVEPGTLDTPLVHESHKGMRHYLMKHVNYADLEASEYLRWRREADDGAASGQMQIRGRGAKRRAVKKRVWSRMPMRPAARFAWMYVVKRGFLDGPEGRVFCQLIASYEAMIEAFVLEREGESHLHEPSGTAH